MNRVLAKFHCACKPGDRRPSGPLLLGLHTPRAAHALLQYDVQLGATRTLSRYDLQKNDNSEPSARCHPNACLTLVLPIRWLYSWPSMCVHRSIVHAGQPPDVLHAYVWAYAPLTLFSQSPRTSQPPYLLWPGRLSLQVRVV